MKKVAKYYVSKNEKEETFTIKLRGRVVACETDLILMGCTVRVKGKGAKKGLEVVCDNFLKDDGRTVGAFGKYEVPLDFKNKPFRLDTGENVEDAIICHCKEGQVFIR